MNWFGWSRSRTGADSRAGTSCSGSLLVTGSSGNVAALIVPLLRARGFTLRLADRAGMGDEQADLSDAAACDRVVAGVDGIVHLAGASKESTFENLLADNTVALANLLRSAARARVPRFVFASSMHVMGMYRRDERFDEASPPRPDSYYAASKLHGEALCRLFHEEAGMAVTCLRLGSVAAERKTRTRRRGSARRTSLRCRNRAFPAAAVFRDLSRRGRLQGRATARQPCHSVRYRCARPGDYDAALRKVRAWWHSDEMARISRRVVRGWPSRRMTGGIRRSHCRDCTHRHLQRHRATVHEPRWQGVLARRGAFRTAGIGVHCCRPLPRRIPRPHSDPE